MSVLAFILGIFAFVFFLVEFFDHYQSRAGRLYWLSLGLAFTVAMLIVQFCTTSHPIHF